jgi:hypothetical protein
MDRLSAGVKTELDQRIVQNYAPTRLGAKWYEIMKPSLNPGWRLATVALRYPQPSSGGDAVKLGSLGLSLRR